MSHLFTQTYSFWAGIIGGTFLTTASHGTEQLLVQRLLAAPTERQSRAALLASWVVIFLQFTLFLIIGVCLFTLYADRHWNPPDVPDKIYPLFIWEHLPTGIAGLVIAAILAAAMSNLSAALNSLASTTVMDFWKPLSAPKARRPLAGHLPATRRSVGLPCCSEWGCSPANGAASCRPACRSPPFSTVRLLGVFLLGLLTRRVGELAAMCAMVVGLALMLYIRFATPIAWTWYVLIGTAATFAHRLSRVTGS